MTMTIPSTVRIVIVSPDTSSTAITEACTDLGVVVACGNDPQLAAAEQKARAARRGL